MPCDFAGQRIKSELGANWVFCYDCGPTAGRERVRPWSRLRPHMPKTRASAKRQPVAEAAPPKPRRARPIAAPASRLAAWSGIASELYSASALVAPREISYVDAIR
jgi:hypothetical protein